MVRRRSTVRFRNGAPLKDQVRSSLDSSHPTLRMGAVAVLGGIWEIVFCAILFFQADGAHLVGPRGSADRCRAPRRAALLTGGSQLERPGPFLDPPVLMAV